jgi:glycosyltransferase involved in cell wall biosynthesis
MEANNLKAVKNDWITIGIPVYNGELYVKQCLFSALNQTYPAIEILIIDDKGTDSSMDIVRSIKAEHPRGECIRIIENDENQGIGISKSRLIEHARGDYFFFIDDDDEISPNCIEQMYNKIISAGVEMVCGSHQIIYPDHRTEDFVINGNVVRGESILIEYFRPHNSIYIWNKLYKTAVLKKYPVYYSGRFLEDVNMSFQIFAAVRSCCDLSEITYFHHDRPTSFSLNYDGNKNIRIVQALDSFFKYTNDKIRTLNPAYRIKIKEKLCAQRLLFCSWIIGGEHEKHIKQFFNPAYLQDNDIWKSPVLFFFYLFSLMPSGIQIKTAPLLLKIKKHFSFRTLGNRRIFM